MTKAIGSCIMQNVLVWLRHALAAAFSSFVVSMRAYSSMNDFCHWISFTGFGAEAPAGNKERMIDWNEVGMSISSLSSLEDTSVPCWRFSLVQTRKKSHFHDTRKPVPTTPRKIQTKCSMQSWRSASACITTK